MSGDSFVKALKQSSETENTGMVFVCLFVLQMSNQGHFLCSPLEMSSDLGTFEEARIQKSA